MGERTSRARTRPRDIVQRDRSPCATRAGMLRRIARASSRSITWMPSQYKPHRGRLEGYHARGPGSTPISRAASRRHERLQRHAAVHGDTQRGCRAGSTQRHVTRAAGCARWSPGAAGKGSARRREARRPRSLPAGPGSEGGRPPCGSRRTARPSAPRCPLRMFSSASRGTPGLQPHQPVAEPVGKLHAVRAHDHGGAGSRHLPDDLLDHAARVRVHARRRLVQQENPRGKGKGARKGHALLLSAGKRGGRAALEPGKAHAAEAPTRPSRFLSPRHAPHPRSP